MNELVIGLSQSVYVLTIAMVFVVLFATMLRTLKEMSLFTPGTSTVVALAVAGLCLIGLHYFLVSGQDSRAVSGHPSESNTQTAIEVILLPYAALAIAILVCLLLLGISRIFADRRREECPAREETTVTKSEKHQNRNEEKRIRK